MSSDNRTFVAVAVVLVLLVATPFAIQEVRDALRPRLDGVRIVSATAADPVFRTGPRVVAPDDPVTIAAAVRIRRAGNDVAWIAPGGRLEIDGAAVETVAGTAWPEAGRQLRTFWFTLESVGIGGTLSAAEAARGLRYRTFLAPELGRGLRAAGIPEPHNDDHLGDLVTAPPIAAGTIRVYARVELVTAPDDLRPLAAVTTTGADDVLDTTFPSLRLQADLAPGVRPEAGELFRLPGYEPPSVGAGIADRATVEVLGIGFAELVRRRLVTSSATFAAVAATGAVDADPADLPAVASLDWTGSTVLLGGRTARWARDLAPGDLLESDGHWLVALADDGDGVVGPADRFAHCWRRPPEITTLAAALGPDRAGLTVHRHGG